MNCPDESVLASFVKCDLSKEDSEKLEEHLAECAVCRQKLSDLEKEQSPGLELPSSTYSIISGESTAQRRVEDALENGDLIHLPQQVGPYLLTERLGQGGMGVVYAAEHQILHRKFAVKFIRPKFLLNSSSLERFQKEILAAGKLVHPNVVSATDAGVFENVPFLVMEFLPGESLATYVKRKGGRLPLREALNILSQAAFGLEFAHSVGLIHFDVKPSNLWRLPDGTVKVMDLGLAHASDELEKITTHSVLGTPNFMAPEQCIPHAKIDARADVYALGCVFFYLLTGLTQNDCVCGEIDFPDLKDAGVSVPRKIQNFLNLATKTAAHKRIPSMRDVCLTLTEFRKPFWKKSNFKFKVLCIVLEVIAVIFLLGKVCKLQKRTGENTVSETLNQQIVELEPTGNWPESPVIEIPEPQAVEILEPPVTEPPEPQTVESSEQQIVETPEPQIVEPSEAQAVEPPEPQAVEPPEPQAVEPPEPQAVEPSEAQAVETPEAQAAEPSEPPAAETSEPPAAEPLEAQVTEPAHPVKKPKRKRKKPVSQSESELRKSEEDARFEQYFEKVDAEYQRRDAREQEEEEYEALLARPNDPHEYFPYRDVPKPPMENSREIPEIDWSLQNSDSFSFVTYAEDAEKRKAAEVYESAKKLEKRTWKNLKTENLEECFNAEVMKNFTEAANRYKEAIQLGSEDAIHSLWDLYWYKVYVPEDPEELFRQLQDSARKGNIGAIGSLGLEYWFGKYHKKEPEKAVQWFMNAINSNQKNEDVHTCLFYLGQAYDLGIGVPRSHENALICYECATSSADAICEVGICYLTGNGYEKDEDKAIGLFLRSMVYCTKGAFMFAYCYEHNIAIRKDLAKEKREEMALTLYHLAIVHNKIYKILGFPSEITPELLERFPSRLYSQAEFYKSPETKEEDDEEED